MSKRVINQIYNSVSVYIGVALRPDTTNHSPNVPTPHNSPVWNSTNPISAAVVSTACPHSWAYHRPQIRPFWLLGCMPVITPKNMLIPQDSPPPTMDLWLHYCMSMPLKMSLLLKVPWLWDQRQRALGVFNRACWHVSNIQFTQALEATWWEDSEKMGFMCGLTKGLLKYHGSAYTCEVAQILGLYWKLRRTNEKVVAFYSVIFPQKRPNNQILQDILHSKMPTWSPKSPPPTVNKAFSLCGL